MCMTDNGQAQDVSYSILIITKILNILYVCLLDIYYVVLYSHNNKLIGL